MQLRARGKASAEDQAVAACLDKRDQDGFKLLFINNCIGMYAACLPTVIVIILNILKQCLPLLCKVVQSQLISKDHVSFLSIHYLL